MSSSSGKSPTWMQYGNRADISDGSAASSNDEDGTGTQSFCCAPILPRPTPVAPPSGQLVHKRRIDYNIIPEPSSASLSSLQLSTDGERLLAQELTSLSIKERDTVYEDIHGVLKEPEETEELRKRSLKKLEAEMKGINNAGSVAYAGYSKESYLKAAFLAPRITDDVHMRVMLLRSVHWDIKKAAKLLLRHFEVKEQLFGSKRLLRPITFDDLSEDAKESIQLGAFQLYDPSAGHDSESSPGRRCVFVDIFANWRYQSSLSHVQAIWYMNYVINHSEHTQRKGLVAVSYTLGASSAQFIKAVTMARWNFIDALPSRVSGIHFCISDALIRPLYSAMLSALPSDVRLRSKVHCGSVLECNYGVTAFGIPSEILPLDNKGTIELTRLIRTLEMCQQHDKEVLRVYKGDKPAYCVEKPPTPFDVALGRGRPYQHFAGNLRFTELLKGCKSSYDKCKTKPEKTRKIFELYQSMKASGARFLKHDDTGDWWVEVSDEVARERVAMSLRNLARK